MNNEHNRPKKGEFRPPTRNRPSRLAWIVFLLIFPAVPAPLASANLIAYGHLRRGFEINKGQIDSRIQFLYRSKQFLFFLTKEEAILSFPSSGAHPLRIRPAGKGLNPRAVPEGENPLPARTGYFLGSRGHFSAANYERVIYRNVYRGVDMIYRGGADSLEYDLLVHPKADLRRIRLCINGFETLSIGPQGDLLLGTAAGTVRQFKPAAYQEIGGRRIMVAARYRIRNGNEVTFEAGPYDHRRTLVIDPVLGFSSLLSGSGSSAGMAVAVDAAGNTYVAGLTAAADFPLKDGVQPALEGGADVFVSKINPSGTEFVYSTFLGGSSQDVAYGLAIDGKGQAYVTGATWSSDFPLKNALQSANAGGQDAFLSVLAADGQSLVYSTYFGGSGQDAAYAIASNPQGQVTLAGMSGSADFPLKSAFQSGFAGGIKDGFIAQFSPAGSLIFSTFLGGSAGDECRGVALDGSGNIYVTGATWSSNFPVFGTLEPFHAGDYSHAFAAELNASGSALVYATFLGGSGQDIGNAIAVDSEGAAYVAGETSSDDFPIVKGQQATLGNEGGENAFLAKLSPGGTALVYSTYLGGSGNDFASGLALAPSGNMMITGGTASSDFPLSGSLVAPDSGLGDVFVVSLPLSGAPAFSTLLGGSLGEAGTADAADGSGNVFVTGWTNSGDFPVFNAMEGNSDGDGDAFIAKLSPSESSSDIQTVSAASYVAPLAPNSIAAAFGANLSQSTQIASSVPLPMSLAGVSVQVTDSQGVRRPASLFAVTPNQVNYLIPGGTAPGLASVTLTRADGSTLTGSVNVSAVAPALFAANQNGQGVASAIAVVVSGTTQTTFPVFSSGAPGTITAVPINLAASGTEVYLELYGSGIRGRSSLADIQVNLGGQSVQPLYAGPSQFVGLDQINVALPESLRGSGDVAVTVTVDGMTSNTVSVNIL